jgi:hypothetical protein
MEQIGLDALRGRVTDAHIEHDDWCRLLRQRGACNCDPDITLACADGSYAVDRSGNARRVRGAPGRAAR